MNIGFVGLGRMGVPMAQNLNKAGFALTIWNRTRKKADDLASELDAVVAKTPVELTENCEIIISMLADDEATKEVYLNKKDGLFSSKGAKLFIEMGTISFAHIKHLANSAPKNSHFIDAPVSGSTNAAQDAQLLIMAGCGKDDYPPLTPIFGALGRKVIYLDHLGDGIVMKLSVNALIHGLNQNLSEALLLAQAAGISAEKAYEVIENSAAAAPMLHFRRGLYLDESAHDVTFSVALANKDMQLITDFAKTLNTPMPQGKITYDILGDAQKSGFGERDMASILSYMREIYQ